LLVVYKARLVVRRPNVFRASVLQAEMRGPEFVGASVGKRRSGYIYGRKAIYCKYSDPDETLDVLDQRNNEHLRSLTAILPAKEL
jgi:hypothetical protein